MWWEVLGIERDATLKEVKRAYAKLIKGAYQSGDQEEIIKIQNAYQSGCEYIRSQGEGRKKTFKPRIFDIESTPVFNFPEYESNDTEESNDTDESNDNIDDFEENLNNTYEEKIRFNNEDKIRFNNEDKIRFNDGEKIKFNDEEKIKFNDGEKIKFNDEEKIKFNNEDKIRFNDEEKIKFNDVDNNESKKREKIKWDGIDNDDLIYEEAQLHMKNCEATFDPIYTDMKKRFDIEKWKELFSNLSSSQKEYFQKYGYKYFNEHYQLPYDIWLVIDENLKLRSMLSFIHKEKLIFDDTLEYYIHKGYSYEKLEEFFMLRSKAYKAYMDMEYKKCLNICDKANKINSKDAGIIKLRGLCNFDLGNYKLSYWNFKELEAYDRYKLEAKRYIGDIYWKHKDFEKAEELYEEITVEGNRFLKIKKQIKSLKNKFKKFILDNKYFEVDSYSTFCSIVKFLFYIILFLTGIGFFISMVVSSQGLLPIGLIGGFVAYSMKGKNK